MRPILKPLKGPWAMDLPHGLCRAPHCPWPPGRDFCLVQAPRSWEIQKMVVSSPVETPRYDGYLYGFMEKHGIFIWVYMGLWISISGWWLSHLPLVGNVLLIMVNITGYYMVNDG